MSKRNNKRFLYLKIHKNKNGDELWISPKGMNQEFYLTDKKITMKKIQNWEIPNGKLL